jgi:PhnB protein
MPTMPYIHFQGQCADAMAFYAQVFGGTDAQSMRYADGPGAGPAWTASDRLMHSQITIGDGTLMASDYPPGVEGDPQKGFSVMQSAPDVAAGRAMFDQLATGGAIIDDFKPSFFSPGFGMVQDKFGTHWIISTIPEGATA